MGLIWPAQALAEYLSGLLIGAEVLAGAQGAREACVVGSLGLTARYRAAGYWEDRSLRDEFAAVFARYAQRVALIDGDRSYTYADVDRLSTNCALNLLEFGLRPLDRDSLVSRVWLDAA